MIFRIKLRWWTSLIAAVLMWLVAWQVGGTAQLTGRLKSVEAAIGVGVMAGLACMVCNFLIDRALRIGFSQRYASRFEKFALDVIGRMRPLDALAGGLMAGVGEEPLFRGVLIPLCDPPVIGILVSAVVFGLAHYLRREYFGFLIWGMGEGLVFGSLFVLTGSLLVPAIAHGMFDFVGFLYFERIRDSSERQP